MVTKGPRGCCTARASEREGSGRLLEGVWGAERVRERLVVETRGNPLALWELPR